MLKRIQVIDSHTGGEPTRVVVQGGPDLGWGPVVERLQRFRQQHDGFRSAIVNEPRGSDVLVGALLLEPHEPGCSAGVIFFNNVGYLGMCGHGTIGLVVTLSHLGRLEPGPCRIETSVGVVTASLAEDGEVSVANVSSWRKAHRARVEVPEIGPVIGDVAWGGNWFFLVESPTWDLDVLGFEQLTELTWKIRQAVNAQGFPEVDHIEVFGKPRHGGHSRNFVLCPGKAYDRSPCGTGTSAKLACLAADGKLAESDAWVQESMLGSKFTGRFRWIDRARGEVAPTITGSAFITAEANLLIDPNDPFCWGIATHSAPQ